MNLIDGKIVNIDEFKSLFLKKSSFVQAPLIHEVLFSALRKMQNELINKKDIYHTLLNDLQTKTSLPADEIQFSLNALIDFIEIDQLRIKLKREFKTEYPFEIKRNTMRENHFEAFYPLGVLVHITPSNSPLLSTLGIIEGLLAGNVNLLKLGRKDSDFSILFFEHLTSLDDSQLLKDYIVIGAISSKDKTFLKTFIQHADVVSAWGNEESIRGIKELVPAGCRVVEWGHKISFSYLTKSKIDDPKFYELMAKEICLNEQQACSSPQCLLVEDASFEELIKIGELLNQELAKISPTMKRILPEGAELAEITIAKEQVRLEESFGTAKLIEAHDRSYRIFIDDIPGINASPLFRSIWLKPMPKKDIVNKLRPLKVYLQTVGLHCNQFEVDELVHAFLMAGVQRVRAIGEMTNSYMGEPHDGEYAITRYCQRVSYSDSGLMNHRASFENKLIGHLDKKAPIMTKESFQKSVVDKKYSDLFFHSGGSSGEPKLSIFTYDDYHRQMEVAADGLYAAGLDPKTDRTMNLFYAGNLYGGFTSFFTILEMMEAVQFPMGASTDFKLVADTIVKNHVDTILGMPSYIMQLFREQSAELKKARTIKKIFFGGEHMSLAQQNYLKKEFGVMLIRSATYGSVDAGPLGFQCIHSTGTIHHLHERLHSMEVVDLETDTPVKSGDVGRLIFTSKVRHGQNITRYEIGDVGRIIEGVCECGRSGMRFELLGRHGDVFRIGTMFLSYQKFQKILMDVFEFEGVFQIQLIAGDKQKKEKIEISIEDIITQKDSEELKKIFIQNYEALSEAVVKDQVLDIEINIKKRDELIFNPKTGKLKTVIDTRMAK